MQCQDKTCCMTAVLILYHIRSKTLEGFIEKSSNVAKSSHAAQSTHNITLREITKKNCSAKAYSCPIILYYFVVQDLFKFGSARSHNIVNQKDTVI